MAGATASSPTDDATLTAQISQYNITPSRSVLSSMANVAPKAKQAEINCQGYLLNNKYVRP